jgi:uncharacterized membrane protein
MKLLGHPIHQQLVGLPLGILTSAVIFDVIALAARNSFLFRMAFWLIGVGLIAGALAAVFGLMDWIGLPQKTRARRVGAWHAISNVVALTLFAASWLFRRPSPDAPVGYALAASFAGICALLVAGWLGGELVNRMGVGVDDGANLNAPSSLSGKPIRSNAKSSGTRAA